MILEFDWQIKELEFFFNFVFQVKLELKCFLIPSFTNRFTILMRNFYKFKEIVTYLI